jgi:hypothetical protein
VTDQNRFPVPILFFFKAIDQESSPGIYIVLKQRRAINARYFPSAHTLPFRGLPHPVTGFLLVPVMEIGDPGVGISHLVKGGQTHPNPSL